MNVKDVYNALSDEKKEFLMAYYGNVSKAREGIMIGQAAAYRLTNHKHFKSLLSLAKEGIEETEISLDELPEFTRDRLEDILNNLANGRAVTVDSKGKKRFIKCTDSNIIKASLALADMKQFAVKGTQGTETDIRQAALNDFFNKVSTKGFTLPVPHSIPS